MKNPYPRTLAELLVYLKCYPVLDVRLPSKDCTYTFKECDGIRVIFTKDDGTDSQFPCNSASSVVSGKLEFNEDGFTRTLGRHIVWYRYREKPWQKTKPEWLKSAAEWDDIIAGMKNFGD